MTPKLPQYLIIHRCADCLREIQRQRVSLAHFAYLVSRVESEEESGEIHQTYLLIDDDLCEPGQCRYLPNSLEG